MLGAKPQQVLLIGLCALLHACGGSNDDSAPPPAPGTPAISDITDRSTPRDTPTGAIGFTVLDVDTPVDSLVLSAASSDVSVIPVENIVFGGAGADRTVTVTPAPNATGAATITITVSDGALSASDAFVLTVSAQNLAPTISNITDRGTPQNVATPAIPFTVGDAESPAASLTLTAASGNTTLVPVANVVFGGSGANRTVIVTPAANETGTATITITVSDGELHASDEFVLIVTAGNSPPNISDVEDRSTPQDTTTGPIRFTVGDAETAVGSLTLSAESSNPAIVPVAGIVFGGSGANRTATVTPSAGATGTTTITITVADGQQLTASDSFVLTVTAANTAPTISNITNQRTMQDTPTDAIAFTVGDAESAAGTLTVSAAISNTALVPVANVVFGGAGANRTVTITPASGATGTATITIAVSDGELTSSDSFVLTVTPAPNSAPTISDIADVTTLAGTPTAAIDFTVGDADTAVGTLALSAASSDAALVPVASIVFGGGGPSRTVTITPAAGEVGTTTITITVSDGELTASDSFLLTVTAAPNAAPTISDISDSSTLAGTPTPAIDFTVGDADTAVGALTLSAASSDPALVPAASIVFSGGGPRRTVTITPAAGEVGTTTITVTVSDGELTASDSFVLTVTAAPNAPPTITSISAVSTLEATATAAIGFMVADAETPAGELTVAATSSNTALVPVANVVFGGGGANRTVTITPVAGEVGTATITISVSDGAATAATSFGVTVTARPLPVGLDSRPSNLTCVAPEREPGGGALIALERVFPSLDFDEPVAMLQAPGDASRWFVLEKDGDVAVFPSTPDASSNDTFVSLDVNDEGEGGLLGMAFHPSWATNRYVFVAYTAGRPMVLYVDRYTSTDDGLTLDPSTREEIVRVNQPGGNQKGGQIGFGPDGFLYVGLGVGGPDGGENNPGQDTTDLLGSILRLDVDGALPYTIPPDNPFAGQAICGPDHTVAANACPELYAWGFRDPARWSFDSATGDLWVGDVGGNRREEIDVVELGGNYGWDCREGTVETNAPPSSCPAASEFIDPVHEYTRPLGNAVTGGYVYRGSALPWLVGDYVFGDADSGAIWRLVADGDGGYEAEQLLDTSLEIVAFAEGNDRELYVLDRHDGGLYALVDGGGTPPGSPVPTLLSATGCVDPDDPSQPASGLVPYDPIAPYWSDNAAMQRWLAIPDGTAIARAGDGDFALPNGSVLMQHFRLNGALIETRLLMRHPDGVWAGYSYEWNAERTDATLVPGGKSVSIAGQPWVFPSEEDCTSCHTAAAGRTLGLEAAQLNHDFFYASTGRTANQLRSLNHIAMFDRPLGDPALQPAMPDPFDASAPLESRARAYLHTNCAQCHRPGAGTAPTALDLRYGTLLSRMAACDVPPSQGDLGLGPAARIVAPGNPESSVLVARMSRRDANGMPPLGPALVDAAGVELVSAWIATLTVCQ